MLLIVQHRHCVTNEKHMINARSGSDQKCLSNLLVSLIRKITICVDMFAH